MYMLNPKLKEFWQTKARNKVLDGGRASSKSHDAAGLAIHLAANYTLKFMCARQFQNKITDSVYTLLVNKIEDSEYKDEFKILNNGIIHKTTGSEFLFYGIARNLDEIKSTEGVDILWLEEAHALTKAQWGVIEPTIRKEDSEIWIIFNPQFVTDFVWQHFIVKPPVSTIRATINYVDNPFLSKTMLSVIDSARKSMSDEEFDHIYLGTPLTNNDRAVIPYKYLVAAKDAHIKLGWPEPGKKALRRVGFDVADDGGDTNVLFYNEGNILREYVEWHGLEDELLLSCQKVYQFAIEHDADVVFDSIGVGAMAGAKFKEMNEVRHGLGQSELVYHGFNAGSSVARPDEVYLELPHKDILRGEHFENAKAAAWDDLACRFRNTYEAITHGTKFHQDELISIDSRMEGFEELALELSTPFKDVSNSGKFMVESKKKLKARGIKSPNKADACVMATLDVEEKAMGFLDYY